MRTHRRNDDGMAMLTALLVIIIVAALGTIAVGVAVHNNDQTAADRRRVQSVATAEGGINAVLRAIETSALDSLPCSGSGALTSPNSAPEWSVTIQYRDAAGGVIACSDATGLTTAPKTALLTSVGKVPGFDLQDRKMEMLVHLEPVLGGFGAAIFSHSTLNIGNNLTLLGNNGNDADVYTNGNFSCSNSPHIYGALYAQGTATLSNSCRFEERVWSNGNLTFNNSASTAEDGISSTGSITLPNGGDPNIEGDATAGTTVNRPAKVSGSVTQNHVQGPPPAQTFPQITYVASAWTASPAPGYTERVFTDCTAARDFLTNPGPSGRSLTTKYVIRITTACALTFSNNTNVTTGAEIAIITNGSVTFENRNDWASTAGAKDLHIIVPYGTSCTSPAGNGRINISNNTQFSDLNVFVYSPCQADIANRAELDGQVFGQLVNINNHFTMTFHPVLVPGFGEIIGFKASVAYTREIN